MRSGNARVSYQISIAPEALDDLRNMPARFRNRTRQLIGDLETDPYPSRSKRLRYPLSHLRRVPLERWRIIYQVDEDEKEVLIIRILRKTGPETYEELE